MEESLNFSTCRISCDLKLLDKLFELLVMKTQTLEEYTRFKPSQRLQKLEKNLFQLQGGKGRARYLYNTFEIRLPEAKKEQKKELAIFKNRLQLMVRFADEECENWAEFCKKYDSLKKHSAKLEEKRKEKLPIFTDYWTGLPHSIRYIYLS